MKDKTASEQATAQNSQKVRAITATSRPAMARDTAERLGFALPRRKSFARQEGARKAALTKGLKVKKKKRRLTVKESLHAREDRRLSFLLRDEMQRRIAKGVGEHAANILLTTVVLSQGAVRSSYYLVDLVAGVYPEANHSVRLEAAKAVLDRALTFNALNGAGKDGANPMNQWTFAQLQAFVERHDGTITLEPASDEQSDRKHLLSEGCNDKVQESSETGEQPQQPSPQVMAPVDAVQDASTSPAADPPPPP